MGFLDKIDDLSSKRKAKRVWFTFVVVIFMTIIVIPSIFVVTKLVTDTVLVSQVMSQPVIMDLITAAVINSFGIAFIVTLLDIVVGLPMAWIMVRRNFRGKGILDTLLDLPLAFPTAVLGISVVMFWGAPEGIPIPGLGLTMEPYTMMILLHILFTYPYMVRSLSAILEQIEPNYETAAMTLGASKWTAVRTISLPLFRAGLATGFILCFARSLSETGGTYIALTIMDIETVFFTGPTFISAMKSGSLDFLGVTPDDAMGAMIFISIVMIVLSLLLLVLVKKIVMRFKIPVKKVWPVFGRKVSRGILPKTKDFLTVAFLLIVVLVPSFYIFTFLTMPHTDIDFGALLMATGTSFLIAGVAVVLDIIFGIPMALYIARNKGSRFAEILDGLVNVPLIIPTTALGFSLALFWDGFGLGEEAAIILVILGHISFTYPLVVRNLVGAIEEVDPSYEEVALTLGAKPFKAFRKILFPIVKSSIIAGGILAFTRSLGETGATLSISTSVNTVPIYITALVEDGDFGDAAMCSITLIAICFVLMFAIRVLNRKRTGRDA